jgi:hypothetical protein
VPVPFPWPSVQKKILPALLSSAHPPRGFARLITVRREIPVAAAIRTTHGSKNLSRDHSSGIFCIHWLPPRRFQNPHSAHNYPAHCPPVTTINSRGGSDLPSGTSGKSKTSTYGLSLALRPLHAPDPQSAGHHFARCFARVFCWLPTSFVGGIAMRGNAFGTPNPLRLTKRILSQFFLYWRSVVLPEWSC